AAPPAGLREPRVRARLASRDGTRRGRAPLPPGVSGASGGVRAYGRRNPSGGGGRFTSIAVGDMSVVASSDASGSAQARRRRVIDLRGDRLGLPTAPHVRQAASQALADGETHYTTRPGLNPLRRAIADKLARENGITVHPEREVLVTCGTREALFVALHVLLERGDEAVVTGPAPRLYRDVVRLAGGRARVVVGARAEGSALAPGAAADAGARRTRAIVLVSPSAPAGCVADDGRLQALAELATARGLAVVSVEALEPFV